MTLNSVMAVTLRYFTEFGKPVLQKTICGGIMHFLVRVQFRRKESSRSLSHLLMSFLFSPATITTTTLGNSLNVDLRAGYLSVHTAGGASDRRRLKARLMDLLILTYEP